MSYIYLIRDTGTGYCKIGKSDNVEKRLSGLQTGNPNKLEVVTSYYSGNAVLAEKQLHRAFSKSRYRGEWFDLSYEQIRSLKLEFEKKQGSLECLYLCKNLPKGFFFLHVSQSKVLLASDKVKVFASYEATTDLILNATKHLELYMPALSDSPYRAYLMEWELFMFLDCFEAFNYGKPLTRTYVTGSFGDIKHRPIGRCVQV